MPLSLTLRYILVGLGHAVLVQAFSPLWINKYISTRVEPILFAASETKDEVVLFYSPNFHRHVVAQLDGQGDIVNVLESFAFLDEAELNYPGARRALTVHSAKIETMAGLGLENLDEYIQVCTDGMAGNDVNMVPSTLASTTGGPQVHRLQEICNQLTAKIGSPFLSFFPQDEHDLVCERIQFLLAPLPAEIKDGMDWPRTFFQGYGAGFTDVQAISAILELRHLLFANPAKASNEKPPTTYFIAALGVTVEGLNQARDALSSLVDGECAQDIATFAHLKSLGISWDQCYILIEAFATSLLSCALERTWEVYDGPGRYQLFQLAVDYLRQRFQLYPAEIVCMLRTHPRLGTYSFQVLKSHADALQSHLGLSSGKLRKLILKSPSLLGASELKVAERVFFFRQTLNFSALAMGRLLEQIPSIMEYSLENNLEPKLDFFIKEVGLSMDILTKAIIARPYLLTLSLEKSLQPTVYGLRDRCKLSPQDLESIYSRAPGLLSMKWATNLEPKINFLVNYLHLDDEALKQMVISSPRILMHSISTSIKPKLDQMEKWADGNLTQVAHVVRDNPSLLETNKATIYKRGSLLRMRNITFIEGFISGGQRKPLSRRKRPVMEVSDTDVLFIWPDVNSAALSIGTSQANMRSILKTGRLYKGKRYIYGELPQIDGTESDGSQASDNAMLNKAIGAETLRDILEQWSTPVANKIRSQESLDGFGKSVYLAAYVTSRVYPTGIEMRGTRRTGALLMYFPQLQGVPIAKELLETAIRDTIDAQVLPDAAGTDYAQGIVLSFYPGTQPSRNRCDLLARINALRLATELIASDPTLRQYNVSLDIITDSGYIAERFRDQELLLEWGSHSHLKDFSILPLKENFDLVYPLARTYYRVTNQLFGTPKYGNRTARIARSIDIRFRHQSELTWTGEDEMIRKGGQLAKRAAEWHYNRVHGGAFRSETPTVK